MPERGIGYSADSPTILRELGLGLLQNEALRPRKAGRCSDPLCAIGRCAVSEGPAAPPRDGQGPKDPSRYNPDENAEQGFAEGTAYDARQADDREDRDIDDEVPDQDGSPGAESFSLHVLPRYSTRTGCKTRRGKTSSIEWAHRDSNPGPTD